MILREKKFRHFKKRQKEKITNMVSIAIQDYYEKNKAFPGKKSKQKIAENIKFILISNNVYLSEADLKLLISSKIVSFKTKLEQGKKPVYNRKNVYLLQKEKNSEKNKKVKQNKKIKEKQYSMMEQDDDFYYIAGYTSNGVPYGITWWEEEIIEKEGEIV